MMRHPKFLSPSALQVWKQNPEEYFLRYLAEVSPPRQPQTQPMSVGSAFDAYIKAFLHRYLFGKNHPNANKFDFDALFTKQVESHNRDWALNAGGHCFRQYKNCGALDELTKLLNHAAEPPQMEFTAVGKAIEEDGVFKGIAIEVIPDDYQSMPHSDAGFVIILGKPDLMFITEQLIKIILDWKVNGFCSNHGVSPVPGYVSLLGDPDRHGRQHKDAVIWFEGDIEMNAVPNLEEKKPDWATQLAAYSWICGANVGEEFIVAVDQLACKPHMPNAPKILVAQHRCNITHSFQRQVYDDFQMLWDIIHSAHIFRDMSAKDSIDRCTQLNKQAAAYHGDTADTQWFRKMMGR